MLIMSTLEHAVYTFNASTQQVLLRFQITIGRAMKMKFLRGVVDESKILLVSNFNS